ncbi:hypothetical protein CoNPh2_CDS0110 [Staphylococcus phage S-CoN_Ph2]|nr:hypothetical protein CoNPh1_CDS0048 [Staphylococcus phage S-CoN_Ph1]WNM51664.1 hypothetical protein CoNPh2_CDS0110 [Staphylococcus phage S-CoN_Ph2]WNM51825.1 hypothetical protein CoNPh3_CDS0111 [Staphylococcus phage S-CoN_Ph3]WNM51930.1 hypothetical protein CoNPh4_CDS0054 [Staphylococcus phage S-CoN_Ph4]WNM52113.1 hypothetical protein CoNPh5_CDS0067 [Staphylococcus phage S-CoN_Ph5]WNM52324.1 hypothetical protein CoNPh6_CDS0114 [Staphylococcus phage S-CoN_Ph6]WNM52497.1 hypothetical protein
MENSTFDFYKTLDKSLVIRYNNIRLIKKENNYYENYNNY